MLRAQNRHRVRVKGDRHDPLDAELPGDLTGSLDHMLVTEVDTVEVADRDDSATEVGRHLAQRAPDPHVVCS